MDSKLFSYDRNALIAMAVVSVMTLFFPFMIDDYGRGGSLINILFWLNNHSDGFMLSCRPNGDAAFCFFLGSITYAIGLGLLLISMISLNPFFNFIRAIALLAALLYPVCIVIGMVVMHSDISFLLCLILLASLVSVYLIGVSVVKHVPKKEIL